jgi:hypothetical protein
MHPGKFLILAGLVLAIAGLLLLYGGKVPFLGKLPGDIRIQRDNFSFYFPLSTCILLSLVVTFILWLFRR